MLLSSNSLMASSESVEMKPAELFSLGNFTVTLTMFSAFIVTLALILLCVVVRVFFIPKWRERKTAGGFQMLLEGLVNMFQTNAKDLSGHYIGFVAPWYLAAAGMVFLGTMIEMIGLRPPTSDINFALMMGLATFVFVHFLGFKQKKAKRLLHYINPLNLLSEAVVPFSLALRMFGSVFSGYLIMHLIYSLPFPVGYPLLGNIMFTLFHAVMQSYIFFMLSMGFIGEAVE